MENQKIIKLLDKIDTDSKHFATKKWYIIIDENNTNYGVNKDTVVQIIQILLSTILEY